MPCSVSGCKAESAYDLNGYGADRTGHSFSLCEKHMPDVLSKAAAEPAPLTVIVERPFLERVELPVDHPDAKGGAVVNTTNASGSSGLTGDSEAAKVARSNQGSTPKEDAKAQKETAGKVDTKPTNP